MMSFLYIWFPFFNCQHSVPPQQANVKGYFPPFYKIQNKTKHYQVILGMSSSPHSIQNLLPCLWMGRFCCHTDKPLTIKFALKGGDDWYLFKSMMNCILQKKERKNQGKWEWKRSESQALVLQGYGGCHSRIWSETSCLETFMKYKM